MKMNERSKLSRLTLGVVIALAAASASAQNTSATIGGRVIGEGGQPVAGAEVTIVHTPSGTVSRAVTDANGRYGARGLRVGGPYRVTAVKDGYEGSVQEGVYLELADSAPVNLDLAAETAELDAVEVIGSATTSVFSPDKMGAGSNISAEQLQAFPSINRNLQDYVRLDPRIAQTDKGRNEISAGGQNFRFNNIRIDGVSINDAFGLESNALPTPRQPISMDAIDAINVSVANYDVGTSGATGAVINAVTKSGTNKFSGTVYGQYRDNDWSGKNQNDVRPSLFDSEATYGLTFGGPLIEDRLFFFANYEKYKGKELFVGAGAGFGPVGSGQSTVVNVTQAQVDEIIAISRNVHGFDPGTLALPANLDTDSEEYAIKIDWNISDQHRANLRYSKSEQSQANLTGFTNNSLALTNRAYIRDFELDTITAQLFSDWNESFSSEFKVSYRDYAAVRTPLDDRPQIQVLVGNASVNLGTEENTHANILETETWNSYFIGNWFLGDHTIKFGAEYETNDIYNLFGRRINGVYRFANIEAYRNGISNQYQLFVPAGNNLDNMAAVWGLNNMAFFVQDTWAFNSNLTFNFGLRFDRPTVDDAPAFNQAAFNAFGFDNSVTVDGEELVQPRAGFNYTFDSERPTQLRGGFGLFQGAAATVWLSNPYSNTGLNYTDRFVATGLTRFSADPSAQLALLQAGQGQTQSVDFISDGLGQPSAWKANLAFDHELPWMGLVATAEAVFTRTNTGIFYQQLNLGAPTAVGQDGRMIYWNANGRDPSRWNQAGTGSSVTARANRNTAFNDAILAAETDKGSGEQLSLSLQKPYGNDDWFAQVSYTYTQAKEVSALTSSTSGTNLGSTMIFQANEEFAARSNYEIRDRFTAAFSWRKNFFGDYKTEFSAFYEGRKGKPYSYVFDNDANGDGRFNDLLYIPNGRGDVLFGSQTEEDAFFAFLEGNGYLSRNQGQVAERNAEFSKWVNQVDIRISQELPGFFSDNRAEIFVDVTNVGNLIDKSWGRIDETPFPLARGIVEYGGIDPATGKYVYRFNTPDTLNVYDDRGVSRWALQVGFRYEF